MKIGFVMDPLDPINIDADTTFAIMHAALQRGHEIYHILLQDLAIEHDRAIARMHPCTVRRTHGDHYSMQEAVEWPLDALDVIFMRTDPPFDTDYLHATHILDLASAHGTLVLNNPRGLMAANEKLYALNFPDVIPTTLVTRQIPHIKSFVTQMGGKCIIKPIDGHGGEGIFMLRDDDRNLNAILETCTKHGTELVMCQRYIPEARFGDKRILLLHGEPLGALLRIPRDDDHRGNIHVGGSVAAATLTPRDLEIIASVRSKLVEDGLEFVGIDVLGTYLTEVNVTSPTGIQEMSRLDGVDYSDRVIAHMEHMRS